MLKKIVFALAFVAAALGAAILSGPALADEPPPCPPECLTDTLEIVTWYPSPYSEYEELRLYPKWTYSPCDDNSRGLIYYDNNNTSQDSDDKLMVCRGAELGWREAGYWKLADSGTDNDISYALNGNVGIGTVSPSAKLDVAGNVNVAGKIKVGDDSVSPTAGTIRWTGSDLEVYDGSAWKSLTSGDTTIITSDVTDCNNNGGNWVDAQKLCYLPVAGGCPSGWTQKEDYSTTQGNTCGHDTTEGCEGNTVISFSCNTGSHFRTNKGVESCRYRHVIAAQGRGGGVDCPWLLNATCAATQTEVGCVKTE